MATEPPVPASTAGGVWPPTTTPAWIGRAGYFSDPFCLPHCCGGLFPRYALGALVAAWPPRLGGDPPWVGAGKHLALPRPALCHPQVRVLQLRASRRGLLLRLRTLP
jgi:hypothetical protein